MFLQGCTHADTPLSLSLSYKHTYLFVSHLHSRIDTRGVRKETDSDTRSLMERFRSSGLPEYWRANDADKHVQLFDVPKSSAEYKEVYDILARDAFVTKYEIRRLQRIQNPALWAGYRAYRESKNEPNEIWAVHGSVLDSLDNISANVLGRGVLHFPAFWSYTSGHCSCFQSPGWSPDARIVGSLNYCILLLNHALPAAGGAVAFVSEDVLPFVLYAVVPVIGDIDLFPWLDCSRCC